MFYVSLHIHLYTVRQHQRAVVTWMLGIELSTIGREASALKYWVISSVPDQYVHLKCLTDLDVREMQIKATLNHLLTSAELGLGARLRLGSVSLLVAPALWRLRQDGHDFYFSLDYKA